MLHIWHFSNDQDWMPKNVLGSYFFISYLPQTVLLKSMLADVLLKLVDTNLEVQRTAFDLLIDILLQV